MKRVTACILALLLCLSAAAQAAQPAVLRVEDKVLAEGENSFTLDVVLEGDGTNCGGSFVLWYDSSCLELTGFETGPAVSGAVAVTNPELGDGVAKMSWISLEPLTGGGAIAKATFRVLLEEPTTVEILNPQLLDREGEDLPVTAAQGTIRPEGAQPTTPPPVQETPAQPSQTPDQPSGEKPPAETDKPEQPDPEDPPEIWSNPFTDVPSGSWFHDAVAYVVEEGLFTGTSENTFSPQLSMNRAMLATVLYRRSGETSHVSVLSDFADAETIPAWAAEGMAWAVERGILQGSGGRLMPDAPLTRETLATILFRYTGGEAGEAATLAAFADGASVSPWAAESMAWAVEQSLLQGRSGNLLCPGAVASRAEVAAVLHRWLT